jgi:hypothetical protein
MASASIRTRTVSGGRKRYDVTYRLGGRAYPKVHGGSFGTLREAETRRTVIAGWLAAGRNPAAELANQLEPAKPRLTLGAWCERYKTTRIDISPATMTTQNYHLKAMSTLAGRDPATLTPADVQEWVTGLSADLKPSSIRLYLQTLRLVLDFAGCDPNPARDRRVKLPAIVTRKSCRQP